MKEYLVYQEINIFDILDICVQFPVHTSIYLTGKTGTVDEVLERPLELWLTIKQCNNLEVQ